MSTFHRHIRQIWLPGLMVILAALAAETASAQIAAPRLNAMTNPASAPYNPAVTLMKGRSSITLSALNTEVTEGPIGVSGVIVAKGSGSDGKIELVGDSFGMTLAGSTLNLALQAPAPPGDLEIKRTLGAVSWSGGDYFSFGFGIQSEGFSDPNMNERSRTPSAGLVLRLGGFYLGGSVGEENVTVSQTLPPSQAEADRSVWNLGMAVRWREEAEGLHLQAWKQNAKESALGAFSLQEEDITGGTVEAIIFNIVFAFETYSTKRLDATTGQPTLKSTNSTAGIGLDFESGLGIQLAVNIMEEEDTLNAVQRDIETSIVSLGWLF